MTLPGLGVFRPRPGFFPCSEVTDPGTHGRFTRPGGACAGSRRIMPYMSDGARTMDNSDVFKGLASQAGVTISVLYLARLREVLGTDREELTLPGAAPTVAALRAFLLERGGVWSKELAPDRPVRVAVNQDMARSDTVLRTGDEIALFPPVTGG